MTDAQPEDTWVSPDEVLREEANQIHTGKNKERRVSRVLQALASAAESVQRSGSGNGDTKTGDTQASHGEPAKRWTDIVPAREGMELRAELYDRFSTALCLSGGGIRSASFNVGVIEALAVHPRRDTTASEGAAPAPDHTHSFLSQFDYLSTVSGGGY